MKRYQIFCFYPDEGWSIMYSTDNLDDAKEVYEAFKDNHGEDGMVLADVLQANNATQLQAPVCLI